MIRRLLSKLFGLGNAKSGALQTADERPTQEAPLKAALPDFDQFRSQIKAKLRRAGIMGDPLEHSYSALLDIVDLLLTLRAETERLVNEARRSANSMADPSNVLAPRVINQVRKEMRGLALVSLLGQYAAPFSRLAGTLFFSISLVYCVHKLTGREGAAMDRFHNAAGQYGDAWTTFISQNNLPGMISTCHRSGTNAVDAQGRHYCYVLVVLEGTESQMPTTPAWAQSVTGDPRP